MSESEQVKTEIGHIMSAHRTIIKTFVDMMLTTLQVGTCTDPEVDYNELIPLTVDFYLDDVSSKIDAVFSNQQGGADNV